MERKCATWQIVDLTLVLVPVHVQAMLASAVLCMQAMQREVDEEDEEEQGGEGMRDGG